VSFWSFLFELILIYSLSLSTEEPERIKKQIEEKVDILGDEDVVHVFFTAQYYLQ
jgi:hypothetical protein